nr:guanylate kinase [Oscillatoria laete-virens]
MIQRKGVIFVVSAPSGAGKTTLCNSLRQRQDLVYSISCTTRPPRGTEVHGEDYYFLAQDDFEGKIRRGEFLEYAQVHTTHYYGTLKQTVFDILDQGKDVLLDIDVQGAAKIRASTDPRIREAFVDIFMMPPTMAELERRLRKRKTETDEQIALRLDTARREIPQCRNYQYIILSESIEEDLDKFRAIMRAERYKSHRIIFDEKNI